MTSFKFKQGLLVLASGMLFATGAAMAQSTTQGAISGTVFDSTGAAIPKATVLIHNDANGADQTLTSGDAGNFRAPQLAPGTYTVTVTATGFSPEKTVNVVVQVNGITELNPHLTTGETSTAVEVTAEAPVLQFESTDFGGHLDNKEIESIPINNRRWSSLALTTPGVVNDTSGFGLLSFRAIASVGNNVEIDGADDNQAFFSEERGRTRAGYSTSQGAVREFQVNTGVYSAEFGRAMGGVVNSVTKSGGNQFHGEVYFYNRNSSRSAFQPFATNTLYNSTTGQYVTSPYRPKDNRNQYGFAVGGPIKKDKLFFFYAFDQYKRNFPGTSKAATPGSFFVAPDAALPTGATCNLATGAVTGASTVDGYACILAARLKYATYAAGAAAFNAQLQAILPDTGTVPRFGDQTINTPKLDWQINSKEHVSFLYHRLRWDSPGGVQTQGTNNYAIDSFGTDFVKLDYGLAKLDSQIRTNLVNEIRYQYGRELNDEGLQPTSAYTKTNLINNTGFAPEVNLMGSGTGLYLGMPYYSFRVAYPDERKWQIGDTATLQLGKHAIRFGTDIVHNYDLQNNLYEGNGFVSYTTAGTGLVNYFSDLLAKNNAQPGTCGTGAAGVGNLYCYNSYAQGFGPSTFDMNTLDYGFFAQDDWKVTPRLTLNIGARYDYESFPAPFAAGNAALVTIPQVLKKPSDKNNIAPRLGFAWDPFGLGKTAVHGGFGFYYGRIPNAVILNAYENTGATASQNLASFTPTTAVTAGQNLPSLTTAAASPVFGTGSVQYLDSHLQNPYGEQFDLAVQQDLGLNNVLSVSYLGTLGRELPNYLNYNLDPTKTYTYTYTVAPGANGTCGPLACGTYQSKAYAGKQQTGTTASTYNNILLNPNYSAVTGTVSNINSAYHALSVDVTNRSWKLITFDANYTWAHATDFSQTSFTANGTNNWLDPYANPRSNYGTSFLNVKHRAVGWAVINAPGLSGHGPLTYLTNGWSLKPLVQMQSGLPYSINISGTTPNQCYVAGCLEAAGTSGMLGTGVTYQPVVGRNTFQLPRTIVVDLRAQKEFTIAEHYNLQLIGEAFNLANHQNVTGVNTTGYALTTVTGTNTNTLTYQSGFQTVQTANSNYAYNPRLIQVALRLQF